MKFLCKKWVKGFTEGGVYNVIPSRIGLVIINDEGQCVRLSNIPLYKDSRIERKIVAT